MHYKLFSEYYIRSIKKGTRKYVFVLFVVMSCCTPKFNTPNELTEYILDEHNGLKQTKLIGELKYSLAYHPSDLLVYQELEGGQLIDDSMVYTIKEKYKNYDYYILSISAGGKDALHGASGNMESFSRNLQNISFHMNQYAYEITSEKDTLPLLDFYFPRLYGMGSSTQVMLAFAKNDKAREYTDVYIEDIGLGSGTQIFRFKLEDIRSIPELKYNINI